MGKMEAQIEAAAQRLVDKSAELGGCPTQLLADMMEDERRFAIEITRAALAAHQPSGEVEGIVERARELLAAEMDMPHLTTRILEASADHGVFVTPAQALRAIETALTLSNRGREEAIEAAAGVAGVRAAQYEADEADFKAREKWDMRALVAGKAAVCRELETAIRSLAPRSEGEG